ncbi:MAG: HAD family hydrolase [Acidimicrobiia bacterium]
MADQPILPSWCKGATRTSIEEFLDATDDIPVGERVAVFDNDGTLWSEKPAYTQVRFFQKELQIAVADHPDLAERPEVAAILSGDSAAIGSLGLERIAVALMDIHTGITPAAFSRRVADFFATEQHPTRGPYRNTRYQPMLELLDELRARHFDCFVVSAGGAEFVRVISGDFYDVSPEGVVGSQVDYDFARDENGGVQLMRTNTLATGSPNEGPTKPSNIQRILGRHPCVAGGNSAGDAEMLEYAKAYDGPSLALLVNHDDGDREYAYESVAGTFAADELITDTAVRLGWTVISIKHDWSTVFAES